MCCELSYVYLCFQSKQHGQVETKHCQDKPLPSASNPVHILNYKGTPATTQASAAYATLRYGGATYPCLRPV